MGRRIVTVGPLTDAQIKAIYDHAATLKVHVRLWNEGFGPNRSYFKWAVEGGVFRIGKMVSYLRTLR